MWEFVAVATSNATAADWLLLVSGTFLLLYVLGTWNYDFFSVRGIPSTRPRFPFIGDILIGFLGFINFTDLMQGIYDRSNGHAIYGIFEFTRPAYFVRSPELLKYITVKKFDQFMNHRDVINGDPDPIFNRNLFSLKDEHWREMRATLSPAFTTSKIKGTLALVAECAEQMTAHLWRRQRAASQGHLNASIEVDMKNLFTRMANDAIATVAFGLKCNSLEEPENEFYRQGKVLTTFTVPRMIIFILYGVIPKIMKVLGMRVFNPKAVSFLDSLVHETIHERQKKNIFRPDMLQLLMQARDGKLKIEEEDKHEIDSTGTTKHKLTNEDISGQALIFFFAGFETVSTMLCFTTYALAHHPEIQKHLIEEIDEVIQQSSGKLTYEVVQGMKYLDAVVAESLRLYPPTINLDRICKEDTTLPPTAKSPTVHLKKGDFIFIFILGIHRDPEYWPDPSKFDPDRFSDRNKHSIKPFTYMPFGLGPRICIGQRFAILEVKMVLIHLLGNFELQPSSKLIYPMTYEKGFNTSIRGGFWCNLIPREKKFIQATTNQ